MRVQRQVTDVTPSIRKIREKAKELEGTEYEPYSTTELAKWARVDPTRKTKVVQELRDKSETSWLNFIKKHEKEVREEVRVAMEKERREERLIRLTTKSFEDKSRLKDKKWKKTFLIKAKLERIVIEEMQSKRRGAPRRN